MRDATHRLDDVGDSSPANRDDPSFLSPQTLAPVAGDDVAKSTSTPGRAAGETGDSEAGDFRTSCYDPSFLSPQTLTPMASDDTAKSMSASASTPTSGRAAGGIGDYELQGEIARGGMGVVYKARHRTLGREVALKMVLNGGGSEISVRRFEQEAKAAAALDHPGIVPLFDFGVNDGQPYFTMPLVPGGSLASRVCQGGPLAPEETIRLMRAVTDAVEYAHRRGVVHRDLKPANILIDADGRPRITDFGLAKMRDGGDAANLTAPGEIMGTPAYMAPEQAQPGPVPVGPAADVYSLGGILYFLLTGQPPFQGKSLTDLLLQVVQKAPTPPRQVNPSVPADLEAVCLRCLEKDPARRCSAEELSRALVPRAADVHDTASMPPVAALQAPPTGQRGWGQALLALAALALVCLVGGAVLAYSKRGKSEADPARAPAQPGPAGDEKASGKKLDEATLLWLDDLKKRGEHLEAEFVGSKADKDGVHRLRPGQKLRLRVNSGEEGHLGAWVISPDGAVTQLFPPAEGKGARLEADKALIIPEEGDIIATPGGGRERLLVVRSSRPWDAARGEKEGPYFVFRDTEKVKVIVTRGLVISPGFASTVIPFEVAPR